MNENSNLIGKMEIKPKWMDDLPVSTTEVMPFVVHECTKERALQMSESYVNFITAFSSSDTNTAVPPLF